MAIRENNSLLTQRACIALFVIILLQTAINVTAETGLYADGSYFLQTIMVARGFLSFDTPRIYAEWTTQFPVVAAIWLGIYNIQYLIYLHTLGLLLPAIFFWLAGFYRLRNEALLFPFIAIYSVVYLNSGSYTIGEYNLLYACVFYSAAILLSYREISRSDALILALLAFFMTRLYQCQVFLGPLLCLLTGLRIKPVWHDKWRVILLLMAIALYMYGAIVALCSILHPLIPYNLKNAEKMDVFFYNWQLDISLTGAALYFCSFMQRLPPWLKNLSGILCLLMAFSLLCCQTWAPIYGHIASRVIVGIAMCLLFAALSIVRVAQNQSNKIFYIFPLILFMALTSASLKNTYGLSVFLNTFQKTVNSRTGFVSFNDTPLNTSEMLTYNPAWNNVATSLLLRNNRKRAIILNAPYGFIWQPLDPRIEMPNLRGFYRD